MPTTRSSIRSIRPTPWSPAISPTFAINAAGFSFSPLTVTGSPRWKPILRWADVLVAFARRSVRHRRRPMLASRRDQVLGDERAAEGGAEWIDALVERVGLQRGEAEPRRELLLRIDDLRRDRARLARLGLQLLVVLRLADVRVAGDDVVSVLVGEDANEHAGVETAGVCEYDFLPGHGISLPKRLRICCASRRVATPRAGVAKMVSSPASVPRHSGMRALSMASATAEAIPGRVRSTTR